MDYEGKIIRVHGDEVTFKLDRDFDLAEAHRLSLSGFPRAIISQVDDRAVTKAQFGMIYGLFNDIALYTGYPPEYTKELMKAMFSAYKGIEDFSMEGYGISQVFAGEFIEYIIEFCFEQEIPFKYQKFHLSSDITRVLFIYLKYKSCFVCGKENSDVHHLNGSTVGMGNDREKVSHVGRRVVCLCREDHGKIHQGGELAFFRKHHIVPIKLTEKEVRLLGI